MGSVLVNLLIVILVVGLILYLVNRFIPLAEPFKQILNIVALVGLLIYIIKVLL